MIAFCIVLLCLAGLAWQLSRAPARGRLAVHDSAYRFTLATVTRGTNHEVFSGNILVAKFKKAVRRSPLGVYPQLRALPRAELYVRPVPLGCTNVVWFGWRMAAGSPHLTVPGSTPAPQLRAEFVGSNGGSLALELASASYMPRGKEFLYAWALPDFPIKYSGCAVRLKDQDGKPIAAYKLK